MVLIYAHRGSSGSYPENTLLAFRKAIEAGVAGIELDVHATSDGIPVIVHDRAIERTTNGAGCVDEMPLARLQGFDAGQGEQIPTLLDVLDIVPATVHLDIEIKGSGIEANVLAVLAGVPRDRWAISSFDWSTLQSLRALDAGIVLWPLTETVDAALFAIARELRAPAVSLYSGAYSAESASSLREAGLAAVIWTVNDLREASRVRDLGAYALCTDYPEQIAQALSAP